MSRPYRRNPPQNMTTMWLSRTSSLHCQTCPMMFKRPGKKLVVLFIRQSKTLLVTEEPTENPGCLTKPWIYWKQKHKLSYATIKGNIRDWLKTTSRPPIVPSRRYVAHLVFKGQCPSKRQMVHHAVVRTKCYSSGVSIFLQSLTTRQLYHVWIWTVLPLQQQMIHLYQWMLQV